MDLILQKFLHFHIYYLGPSIPEKVNYCDLIKMISMASPFTVSEKQMLLESENTQVLAKNLFSLLDYYINKNSNIETIN